jgi:hypothetical protein
MTMLADQPVRLCVYRFRSFDLAAQGRQTGARWHGPPLGELRKPVLVFWRWCVAVGRTCGRDVICSTSVPAVGSCGRGGGWLRGEPELLEQTEVVQAPPSVR